jgi:16S rRNA (adenine1518-N6/adenine1519-N6)-dimethyltransferase
VVYAGGIPLKKKFGQHFLRDERICETMVNGVSIDAANVFEIGCGDGILTRAILKKPIAGLWVFEIDPEWAQYVKTTLQDPRLTMYQEDILAVDFARFEPNAPWILLANLPYQITFPILHKLKEYRHVLREGIVMMQEEVAQKLVQTRGRGYGYPALFFQYYFELTLLTKVPATAFFPPPKVTSRLLYFKPRADVVPIQDEELFWRFVKQCFKQPRRTLKNNLAQSHYDWSLLPESTLALRAQQLTMHDVQNLWSLVNAG